MSDHKAKSAGVMPSYVYDALKFCALIAFPAFGAAYFALASIWGLPAAEQVVGTVTVVDTFLGVVLGITKKQFDNSPAKFDGELEVHSTSEGKLLQLAFDDEDQANAVGAKSEVTFKVQPK